VPMDELIHAVWGAQDNGGPLQAAQAIRVYITRLRRLGYPIRHGSHGYRFQPTIWECPMNGDKKIERDPKRTRKRASDYLPPEETKRLATVIDSLRAQVATLAAEMAMLRANATGDLAVKDMAIADRDAAIAKLAAELAVFTNPPADSTGS
jgi:hypothetical protein